MRSWRASEKRNGPLTLLEKEDFDLPTRGDFELLRSAVQKERFRFETLRSFNRNPMTYARSIDVNIYIKRNFAPLPDRVRSIISILRRSPAIFAAARANLDPAIPKPFVETAIQVAEGSADFLAKELVEAVNELKDPGIMTEFRDANKIAIAELRGFATWLKETKRANSDFAIGRAKYAQMLREGELIDLSPDEILALGLKELEREQSAMAAAARKIDPSKKPLDVLKRIQKDHPTADSLLPDTRKNLEAIRQFLIDRKIVTIPSDVRARVEETPQ